MNFESYGFRREIIFYFICQAVTVGKNFCIWWLYLLKNFLHQKVFFFFFNLEKLRDETGHLLTIYFMSYAPIEFYPLTQIVRCILPVNN